MITIQTKEFKTFFQLSAGIKARQFKGCSSKATGKVIANTNCKLFRREINWFGKSEFINENGTANDWQNFPTQSPICGRDDGLPTELDGITFSKWRSESIKAFGNAIVPQVVLQIFKAIEQYEAKKLSRIGHQ